jgi:hypothetical protein
MALMDTIGNRSPGELIRSDDWRTLVAAVDALTATVETGLAAANARIDDLETRVETLESTLNAFQTRINALLGEYYRVTLETTRETYAIGEQAEIIARVTDLFGQPLALSANNRPWIDFVATWGQFKPIGQFESRGGAGERAISVRTDLNGVARVLLRADHVSADDDADEQVVGSVLATPIAIGAANLPLFSMITQANTPAEAQPAYAVMSQQYLASQPLQRYTDKYFTKDIIDVLKPGRGINTGRWNDHRATVTAFVKNDASALTPDPGRAFSSIQIAFRDWVSPWLGLDFWNMRPNSPPVVDFGTRLGTIFAGDLRIAPEAARRAIETEVAVGGLLGKARGYKIAELAFDVANINEPQRALTAQGVKNGVLMQQALISGLVADQTAPAIGVASTAAAITTQATSTLQSEVTTLRSDLSDTRRSLNTINGRVQEQTGTLNALFAEGGAIRGLQQEVDAVKGNVSRFLDFNPSEVIEKAELLRESNVQLMTRVFEAMNRPPR